MTVDEMIEFLTAVKAGKTGQQKIGDNWIDVDVVKLTAPTRYRIKPDAPREWNIWIRNRISDIGCILPLGKSPQGWDLSDADGPIHVREVLE